MVSPDLRFLIKQRSIFLKIVKISDLPILSGWIGKYKPALSESFSSWDNSYCARLVIVSLPVNIRKLQPLVSADNFLCWVYKDLCSDFLLSDVIDSLRMYKSVVKRCRDIKFLDILSSFKISWSSLLRLLMALRKFLLRIYEASSFETFESLKIRSFGYTPSCLQLLRKSMSNFSLFFL